ncbi:30S ribosomal protein S13 [Candidatus Bathyarchaeota archaeon]|nr:30S ribosomal protein S13 [Candidatus Bathyarchaeota archaeon]
MSREFNYIVRLHGSNLDGTKLLPYALCDLKGVGIRVSKTMIKKLGLDPSLRLGTLSEADVRRLEEILDNPASGGIPNWMLNRRKDLETGKDIHLLGSDLTLRVRDDIDLMKETKSWKGNRHARGLKVRGQRTKTTARKGRSVGVSRSRVQQEQRQQQQ